MPSDRIDPSSISEWMLCEACHYSWLRDPSRPIPTRCPECRQSRPTLIAMPAT